ncbi:MAG: glycerophosphoryl diester phosphodiesterase [Crocinitomicaceae bacterium]|jgi:glycerophosphoryl diester phosphodiesterase
MQKWGLNIVGSIVLFLTLFSCQKKEDFANIDVIGHGGNGLQNPNTLFHDNSLQSIEIALATEGCNGIEVDVQLSSDHTLWLYHDEQLAAETDGEGCLAGKNDAYLAAVVYSTIHKEKLIQLAELPESSLSGKKLYLDVRHMNACNGNEVNMSAYISAINSFRAANPTMLDLIICTGSVSWMSAFKTAGYTVMAQSISMDHYAQITTSFPQLDGIVSANGDISKEDVSLIHADGRKVVIFDIRAAKATRRAFNKLPDALMTDNIRNALIEKY